MLEKDERLVAGLMSGTSADGVDACLVSFRWTGRRRGGGVVRGSQLGEGGPSRLEWRIVSDHFIPYDRSLRARILETAGPDGRVEELCRLDFELGRVMARALEELAAKAGVATSAVDLAASHGHTFRHLPGAEFVSTLQAGESAVIAELCDLPVVDDFRSADAAAGGQGAPLVPVADSLLFSEPGKTVVLVNIGGMANITVLEPSPTSACQGREPGPAWPPAVAAAFDTGPGNVLVDLAVSRLSGGARQFDEGGMMAARGEVSKDLLDWCMSHPFLRKPPPKSTGREEFGRAFLDEFMSRPEASGLDGDSLVATLTAFTSRSVAEAVEMVFSSRGRPGTKCRVPLGKGTGRAVGKAVDRGEAVVLVAGGGSRNRTLMEFLARDCAPLAVSRLGGDDGMLADKREALCFALLGELFLLGLPGASTAVTGAAHPCILGKLSLPPSWLSAGARPVSGRYYSGGAGANEKLRRNGGA